MVDHAAAYRALESRTSRSLITPEGVDLTLKIADAGQRFGALLLDLLFMLVALILVTIILAVAAIAGGPRFVAAPVIIWLIGFFLLRNCYFIIMEMGPRAATFGKRITGLRVIARSGGRLTADAVIARNLMREIELYLPISFLIFNTSQGLADTAAWLFGLGWTFLFAFFPLFNRDRLRVGDLLAGTWVIRTPRKTLGLDLIGRHAASGRLNFTDEQLDTYGQFELQTLEQILRLNRPESLATVADTIRTKIGYWDNSSDVTFLNTYYEAVRGRLERKLLFGRRRRDKFDR
jgi:uncharacterized RDD family membrane protein YckC